MTLSDILARDVQLEFHEAIALIRAIAEASAIVAPSSAPELDQIELLPDGAVEILGSTTTDNPVERLVEMLQTLIGEGLRPPQLTSVIEEPHASVAAFSLALGYFERPNRSLILQDLYSRAGGQPRLPEADELMASLRAAPASDDGNQAEATPDTAAQRRKLVYVAGAVVGVVAVALVIGFWWRARTVPSDPGAPPTLTSRVADGVSGVAGVVGGAVKSMGERVGIGGGSPPPAPVEAAPPPAAPGTGATTAAARGSSRATSPTSGRNVPSAPPVPVSGVAVQGRVTDRAAGTPAAAPASTGGDFVDAVVYSAGAPNVVPPVGLRPHVPKELPPGISPENVARIEIVVDSQGGVESVKLLGPPRMHDAMLLSAAKAWRFRPANKNGSPVSYRMTILVAR